MHDIDKSELNASSIWQNFQASAATFGKNLSVFYRIKEKNYGITENFTKFQKSRWNFTIVSDVKQ